MKRTLDTILVSTAILAVSLVCFGCLTRTRCQTLKFDGCTFTVNEPANLENPSYPRSLQIGVQDQQIEGGTDTIASGNRTPVASPPMGDSAIDAVKSLSSAYLGQGTSAAKAAAEACKDAACAEPAAAK
jgi:hypothetical protein